MEILFSLKTKISKIAELKIAGTERKEKKKLVYHRGNFERTIPFHPLILGTKHYIIVVANSEHIPKSWRTLS